MEITQRSIGRTTILDLVGDIEAGNDAKYFASALARASSPVVLNMAQVRSIDNDGVGMIISGYNGFLQKSGGWIVLVDLSEGVGGIAGSVLGRVLKTFETEQAALDYLTQV